jgi:5-methylcytosine-specific restriction endonuclease McrA
MSFTCCDCGVAIAKNGVRGRNPKRCRKCRLAFRAAAERDAVRQAKHAHECKTCGVKFVSCRKIQHFCSCGCMHLGQRKRVFVCCGNPACNKPIQATPSRLAKGDAYCSWECSQARFPPPLVCQNPKCGRNFRMKHATKNPWQNKGKYCCPECYRDHRWGNHRPRKRRGAAVRRAAGNSALATSLRKRCKVYGVTFDPACTRQAVLDRDGWRCQKCRILCNKEYRLAAKTKSPSCRNAEHDHIVPLSVAGSPGNVFANSQCLCRRCNSKKGDSPEGQLRLCLEEEAWGRGVRVRRQQNSRSCEATQAIGQSTQPSRSRSLMAL